MPSSLYVPGLPAANALALDGLHRHLSALASYSAAAATVDMNRPPGPAALSLKFQRWEASPISFYCFP